MKNMMIKIGNFFFKYRNKAFPIIIILLFVISLPPNEVFGSEKLEAVKDFSAFLISLTGLAFRAVVIGYAYIKRGGMNKKVYAENLVTEGIFAVCRNPLYVGNILIYAGVFLMHGNPLVMLLGMGLYLFIYQCIVLAEEAYLLDKFGDGYRAYCADVPRWIPKFSRFRAATEGMDFDIRRVIVKDYTTLANTFITLAIVEGYEYIELPDSTSYLAFLGTIILLSVLWVITVRWYKKHPKAI